MSDQETRDRRQRKRQMANKKHHHGRRQSKPRNWPGPRGHEHSVNLRNWETQRNDD